MSDNGIIDYLFKEVRYIMDIVHCAVYNVYSIVYNYLSIYIYDLSILALRSMQIVNSDHSNLYSV